MAFPTPRLTAVLWIGVGLLSIVMAAGLLTGLASRDWQIDESASIVAFFGISGVLAGIVGPFVALAGLYVLRRTQTEQRSLSTAAAGTARRVRLGWPPSHSLLPIPEAADCGSEWRRRGRGHEHGARMRHPHRFFCCAIQNCLP
jgi:hypothetical protein